MTNHHDEEQLSARQERVRDLVAGLPRPIASASFRARLREDFISGAIQQNSVSRDSKIVSLRPWYRRSWATLAAPLAAAAVLLLMFSVLNRGPAWTMVEGEGTATIDGVEVSLDDTGAVDAALHGGAKVALSPDARACFLQAGVVLAELKGGSVARLPNAPGRWFGREMRGRVEKGAAHWVTGPRFPGHRLTVETQDLRLIVNGTTFTVMAAPEGTSVCCLEGNVTIEGLPGGSDVVTTGNRKTILPNGEESDVGPLHETERVELAQLVVMADRVMGD